MGDTKMHCLLRMMVSTPLQIVNCYCSASPISGGI